MLDLPNAPLRCRLRSVRVEEPLILGYLLRQHLTNTEIHFSAPEVSGSQSHVRNPKNHNRLTLKQCGTLGLWGHVCAW